MDKLIDCNLFGQYSIVEKRETCVLESASELGWLG